MAGFGHDAPMEREAENPEQDARNAKGGFKLFVIYLALYVIYTLLVTFRLDVMQTEILEGINLAILYGLGLIISAFVISLIYSWMCRVPKTGSSINTTSQHQGETR